MKIDYEKAYLGRWIIWLDRGLNILTGGSFQECLSTRTYILAETSSTLKSRERWCKVRSAINFLFWEGHCKGSFLWEMKLKREFLNKYKQLINKR